MLLPFEEGTAVEVRGETWQLTRVQRFDACAILTLEGRDQTNIGARCRLIAPFDRPRPVSHHKVRKVPRSVAMRSALTAIANIRAGSDLWTAARASIDLFPHQLEPALAVLRGATRVLLADAVGLGKTIQAGLILSELRERGWIERALIVCPAGLRHSWARELRQRFHIAATVLDQTAIAERVSSLPPGVSPWSGHAVAIASIDFIKRPEVLAAIDAEPVDLIVADEAHHLSPGTDRGAAIARIASRAPWCVLLSATPHSGDRAAFDYLTSIGSTGDDLALFRRHRRDAGLPESRRTHVLPVRPSPEEAALLAAIERYARAIWMARGRDDPAVRLVAMTMARRAASSIAAIARTLERRLTLLAGNAPDVSQQALPWQELDAADDLDGDSTLAIAGLSDVGEEQATLRTLLELTRRCTLNAKFRRLQRLLNAVAEPAVVFTEYRDTLTSLAVTLRESSRVESIHGGLSPGDRRAAVDAFNTGGADVLLATDAAGEGLNLHHRCRLVIDLELPWNPMRLEQRVGRVDRIGQRRTVHAIRLFHPHTIESAVLDHLRVRSQRAAAALDRPVREAAIASAIFDGALPDAAAAVIASDSVDVVNEVRRVERQRRLPHPPLATRTMSPLRSQDRSPLIAVRRTAATNSAGYLIAEQVDALLVAARQRSWRRREWRALVTYLESVEAPPAAPPPRRDALTRRIQRIRDHLTRASAIRYQRSLFDRRADAKAADREAIARRLDEALARVLRGIDGQIATRHTELVSVWPERRR